MFSHRRAVWARERSCPLSVHRQYSKIRQRSVSSDKRLYQTGRWNSVIADGSGGAYIKKNAILTYDAYGNSGANPEEFYEDIASSLKPVKGKEGDVPQIISLGSQAFYLKQKKRLYRITMK